MKTLKKVLSLVVVLAMAISLATTASAATAFSDVSETDSYAEAVSILNNLKILQGYEENGDIVFKPSNTVTRAEMAAIMVRTLGYGDPAQTDTVFTDVDSTHWASGYIMAAKTLGIVDGYTDGTFRPGDPVTYEQTMKLIVAALGFNPKANSTLYGGYPTGYLRIASEEGITKGIPGTEAVTGSAAKRSTVARAIFNALEVEMMEQKSFQTDLYGNPIGNFEQGENTLLKTFLKVQKVQGVVTSTYRVEAYDAKNNKITIETTSVDGEALITTKTPNEGNTNAVDYLGYSVTAYIAEDDNGNEYLAAIAPRTGRNVTLDIQFDEFAKEEDISSGDKIYYWPTGTSRSKASTAEISGMREVFENGKKVNKAGYDGYYFIKDLTDEGEGFITLVDNDNDGVYDYIFITSLTSENSKEFVVEKIDEEDFYIEGDGEDFTYDPEDDEILVTFIKDGKAAKFEDIAEEDVVTIIDNDDVVTVYISSAKVEGKISLVDPNSTPNNTDDDVYTITGAQYKKSLVTKPNLAVGDDGVFFLNYKGRIVKADATVASKGSFAYLLAVATTSDFSTTHKIQYVTDKGETVTKELNNKITVYAGSSSTKIKNSVAYKDLEGILYNTVNVNGKEKDLAIQGPIKVTTNASGKVSAIRVYSSDVKLEDKKYDEDSNSIGIHDLDADLVVFTIDTDEVDENDQLKADAIKISKPASVFKDGDLYTVDLYYNTSDEVELAVAYDPVASLDESTGAFIITKVTQKSVDDGDTAIVLTGLQNGKSATYSFLEDSDITYDGEYDLDFAAGDVIMVSVGADGYVSEIVDVIRFSEAVDNVGEEGQYNLYETKEGNLEDQKGYAVVSGNVFEENSSTSFYVGAKVEDQLVRFNSNKANIYLIDNIYSSNRMTVKSSGGSVIKDNYDNWVVVRYYDGVVTDVFYFRGDKK